MNAASGFAGRSIVVTGGGSGIGRAVALLTAAAGASVTVADLDANAATAVAGEITRGGGKACAIQTDVTGEDAVRAMVARALSAFGHLDGACNAAGLPMLGVPTHELSLEAWERISAVNLRGVFLSMKHEITAMLQTGRGAIVNIASTAGVAGIPNGSDYCATKAGVVGLTRGAAIDYARRGIRVNTVLPGITRTPMLMGLLGNTPGMEAQVVETNPMGRMADPIEIGFAVRWLLSDEASFITGTLLAADGGLTAM